MWEYRDRYTEKERFRFMIWMYNEGIKMGCAEGHTLLAECYFNGWGMPASDEKAVEELKQAVAKGSPKGMEIYGTYLDQIAKNTEAGRELLRKFPEHPGSSAHKIARQELPQKNECPCPAY